MVETSPDPLVQDITPILKPLLCPAILDAIEQAKESIITDASSSSSEAAHRRQVKENLRVSHSHHWNNQLNSLQVQRKLLDSITLEESTPVWKRLMVGLPAGQLSFLTMASIDSLPTPTSLAHWNMRISPSCPLCNQPTCTAKHVLSCCPTALHQGRFTWRHDRALRIIFDFVTMQSPTKWSSFL